MSRGEIAMRLLLEMNHEVRGDCVQESIEQVGFLGKVDILYLIYVRLDVS